MTIRKTFYFFRSCIQHIFNFLVTPFFRLTVSEVSDLREFYRTWDFVTSIHNDCELVRYGGNGDGGYFAPRDLQSINYILSPGYGGIKSFEDDERFMDKQIHICDPNFEELSSPRENQYFSRFKLGALDSIDGTEITLKSWANRIDVRNFRKCLLQMDIEGAEWEILESLDFVIEETFEVMLVEFHNLDCLLIDTNFLDRANVVFGKLNKSFINIFCKPNNAGGSFRVGRHIFPKVIEMTLLNKSSPLITKGSGNISQWNYKAFRNSDLHKDISLPYIRIVNSQKE